MTTKVIRQSVSLPAAIARRVKSLAKSRRSSTSRVIVDLIERALEAQDEEKRHFFELTDRLTGTDDLEEQATLKAELARMTFGE